MELHDKGAEAKLVQTPTRGKEHLTSVLIFFLRARAAEIKEQRQEQRQLARAVDLAGHGRDERNQEKRMRVYFFCVYIGGFQRRAQRETVLGAVIAQLPL